MGVYRWKFGSDYRGRRWDQDLPTDAQIVMHMFCTYMDFRLPTDARFPDGRTFTGLYFLKNLDKPGKLSLIQVMCSHFTQRRILQSFPNAQKQWMFLFLSNCCFTESKKRDLAIHRFNQNPPHFKVSNFVCVCLAKR